MREMRRKDREVTDPALIDEIIRQSQCCRLGLAEDGKVYIVPLHFGCVEQDGKRIFYFHSASQGRKLDLIRRNGWAGFELDCGCVLQPAECACEYSAAFRSIIGGGTVTIVENDAEKRAGLEAIMAHSTGKNGWSFDDAAVEKVCVIRLEVQELSCKVHL